MRNKSLANMIFRALILEPSSLRINLKFMQIIVFMKYLLYLMIFTGVPSLVHQCLLQLFELHNDITPQSGLNSACELLNSLMKNASWALKGTYLPLELFLSYIGSLKV